jgi:hypothetical protein
MEEEDEEIDDIDNEYRKKEAKWLQDKCTLDKSRGKMPQDKEKGFLPLDETSCRIYNVSMENADKWVDVQNKDIVCDPKKEEEMLILLKQTYDNVIEVLKSYSDLKDRDYTIIGLWIIGTYFYKEFLTYPYLFLNAMKGSGKSRTLRLICCLSWNGQQVGSMTEAGLFRTAGTGTLGIDEFEGIAKKENHGLREILNSGYKKGMKIIRMKKQKTPEGEQQVPEYFEPYTPIVMANIWGMEEVLGDRCITAILGKSVKPEYVLMTEDYDINPFITSIKNTLNTIKKSDLVSLCRYFSARNIYTEWNNYIKNLYNITTLTTLTTLTTSEIKENICTEMQQSKFETTLNDMKRESLFNRMVNTGLNGRDMELFMPLFFIASRIDDSVLTHILEIAKDMTKEKKQEEMAESKDVMLIDFVSQQYHDFYPIKDLVSNFKLFIDYDKEDEYSNWLNPKWMGRALKRLELITDKRRIGSGREICLNVKKAEEKIKSYKT